MAAVKRLGLWGQISRYVCVHLPFPCQAPSKLISCHTLSYRWWPRICLWWNPKWDSSSSVWKTFTAAVSPIASGSWPQVGSVRFSVTYVTYLYLSVAKKTFVRLTCRLVKWLHGPADVTQYFAYQLDASNYLEGGGQHSLGSFCYVRENLASWESSREDAIYKTKNSFYSGCWTNTSGCQVFCTKARIQKVCCPRLAGQVQNFTGLCFC